MRTTEKSIDISSRYVNFLDEVYFCGVKEFTRSTLRSIKICWSIIVCVGVCATGYYLFNMMHDYAEAPIATKIEFNVSLTADYPNLVLCPENWINYEAFLSLNISLEAVEYGLGHIYAVQKSGYLINASQSGEQEFLNYIQSHKIIDYRDFYILIAKSGDQFCQIADFLRSHVSVDTTKIFSGTQVCYNLRFEKLDCTKQTVNRAPAVEILFSKYDDDYHELFVNPDLKLITDTTPNKILLEPGQNYALSLIPRKFFSIDKPKKRCLLSQAYNSSHYYSQAFCYVDCLQQKYSFANEGCVFVNLVAHKQQQDERGQNFTIYCNAFNRKNPALKRNQSLFDEMGQLCNIECMPPCEHELVEIVVSKAKTKKSQVNTKALVEILYDVCDKGVMEIREYKRYTFENLLADVGGVLGLWISASAMTFVQVLMFLFEIAVMRLFPNRTATSAIAEPLSLEKISANGKNHKF